MIYIGENEYPIYLGDSEIPAIYAGDEMIYPTDFGTLTGITLENLTWVKDVPYSGGTADKDNCLYKVVAHYDSGKGRSVTSKATVTGSLVVPATTAETREMVGVLQLTASYEGFSASGSVDVYQKPVEYEPTGYLHIPLTQPNIVITGFQPYTEYISNGNYLRFELNNDFGTRASANYLWQTARNWFSFERNNYGCHMNLGTTVVIQPSWKPWVTTSGFSSTLVFEFNNNVYTVTKGEESITGTWNGDIGSGDFRLFPTNTVETDFYRLKVFNSPTAQYPVYDFCPALDENNVACIYDAANDEYIYKSGSGTITFIPFE